MVVNISTEFPIERQLVHTDKIFPWLLLVQKAMKENPEQAKKIFLQGVKQTPPTDTEGNDIIQRELIAASKETLDLKEQWKIVGTSWSLYNDLKGDECFQYIEKHFKKLKYEKHPHPRKLITDFLKGIGYGHAASVYNTLVEFWADAWKENPQECLNLLMFFLKRNEFTRTLSFMHGLCSDYMQNFDELMQLKWFYLLELQLTEGLILGSNDFGSVRSFYGDTYEHYGELLYIPTAIKNIVEGRKFDQLKNISLETYSKSEKARRTENLKELARIENMTSVFDAQIRNASHHARIEFDKDTLQILLRPSSKSTERLLTYVQYVDSCNRLFQTTIGLFIFCLEFMHEIMNSFALAHSLNVNLQQAKLDDPEFLAWFERGGSN